MRTTAVTTTAAPAATPLRERADTEDWPAPAAGLDAHGSALTARPVLSPAECRAVAAFYDEPGRLRSTVGTARHSFGSGQ